VSVTPCPSLPTAYCAPGQRVYAGIILALKGEQVADIVEHPWLDGRTDVLIVNPAVFDLPKFEPGDFRVTEGRWPWPRPLTCSATSTACWPSSPRA